MAYLDPKNYFTFKKVFGTYPQLLISLLNALLPLANSRNIKSLEYLPEELKPIIPGYGNLLMDVSCADNHGESFLVEIQMLWTDNFKSRLSFNDSKAFVQPPSRGSYYNDTQPVYSLNFVNETFQQNQNIFYHHYPVVIIEHTKLQIRGLEFVLIELPHFKLPISLEKKMAVLWLRFLTEIAHGTLEAPEDLLQNEETNKALTMLQESNLTPAELEYYDRHRDSITNELIARDELVKRVIMQVKKEEFDKGAQEQKKATAVKMMANDFDDDTINGFTDLAISEIQTLRQAGTLD